MTPSIDAATIPPADDDFIHVQDLNGLHCVDVEIQPQRAGKCCGTIRLWAQENHRYVFAMDDASGLVFMDKNAPRLVGTAVIEEHNYFLQYKIQHNI